MPENKKLFWDGVKFYEENPNPTAEPVILDPSTDPEFSSLYSQRWRILSNAILHESVPRPSLNTPGAALYHGGVFSLGLSLYPLWYFFVLRPTSGFGILDVIATLTTTSVIIVPYLLYGFRSKLDSFFPDWFFAKKREMILARATDKSKYMLYVKSFGVWCKTFRYFSDVKDLDIWLIGIRSKAKIKKPSKAPIHEIDIFDGNSEPGKSGFKL